MSSKVQDNLLQIDEYRTDIIPKALPWTKLVKATNVLIHKNQIRSRWHQLYNANNNIYSSSTNVNNNAAAFTDTGGVVWDVVRVNNTSPGYYGKKFDILNSFTGNYAPSTAARIPFYFEMNNTLYAADQDNQAMCAKFYQTGGTWKSEKMGIKAPTVAGDTLTEISPGTGSIVAGTYYYVYTYVNTLTPGVVQSNYGPVSVSIVIGAGPSNVTLVVTKSTDTQVNKIRLYRGTSSSGPFYYVNEYSHTPGVGTQTLTDSTATAITTIQPPTDHSPLTVDIISFCEFKSRLWAFYGSSNLIAPSNPPETNVNYQEHFSGITYPIGVPGDNVVVGIAFPEFLIIVKQYSMYIMYGDDESSWRVDKILNEGVLSPWAVLKDGPYLYFQNSSGVSRWIPGFYNPVERISTTVYPDTDESFSATGDAALDRNFIILRDPYFDKLWFCHHNGGYLTRGAIDYVLLYDINSNKMVGKFVFGTTNWIFFYKNLIYHLTFHVTDGGYIEQYVLSNPSGTTFDIEIETGYNQGPQYNELKHIRSILILYRKDSSATDTYTVKGVKANGSLVTVGTFTCADGDVFFKAFDGTDRFVGINISCTGAKRYVLFAGMEVKYDATESGG